MILRLWALRVFFFFTIAIWPLVLLLPETHGPTILAARSKKLRKDGRPNARAAHELKQQTKGELLRIHFGRPASAYLPNRAELKDLMQYLQRCS